MKKTETIFICCTMLIAFAIGCVCFYKPRGVESVNKLATTPYGAFLATQHAIYVNDFDAAAQYSASLDADSAQVVKSTKMVADFLSGHLPENASDLAKETGTSAKMIYDAYLVEQGDWKKLYARHKDDKSPFTAPLRIWASVAIDHRTEAIKFVDSLQTNDAWKAFVRGQIYAETGNIERAAAEFSTVNIEFMNINDYLYLMSFYRHHGLFDLADALRDEFTSRPGGMFMSQYNNFPGWSNYSGYKNALAFSLIQNVSHTQVMMYSDLSMLLLRFAQIISADSTNQDAINYYIGQYLFNNDGNYNAYFSKLKSDSPFYLFAMLRDCDNRNDMKKLYRVWNEHPLFVPAINKLVAYNVSKGDRGSALKILNRAMNNDALSDFSHAFLLKSRAHVNFVFGDTQNAQSDLHAASDILGVDAEIVALQAKIWAAENREIETAYEYAMGLLQRNARDVYAWDVLGRVVAVRESDYEALELLGRVGEIAQECSALFEFLGDLYYRTGDTEMARNSYMRAIELSDDGLVVVPQIEKKIRKLK